jgi:hypothetical protein
MDLITSNQLLSNQPPLGSQFQSHNLTSASNYYTLDPFQYSITKIKYNVPGNNRPTENETVIQQKDIQNDPGLIYKNVDFEKLLPAYTSTKKSVNDFPAQSYHRFTANEGYFNPKESFDNTDLWYYSAEKTGGASLNVQEINHIVFPESQRGGLNTQQLARYSGNNQTQIQNNSWESENFKEVNNDSNCSFFDYNHRNNVYVDKVYSFDSDYCRQIKISAPASGSMPFNEFII